MYIKSIKLKNFKSHKDTFVEFDNITSIIGTNSCGKTNILRALKLVLHHENWPVSWITYGEKSSSVEIELMNGNKIIRERTDKNQKVTIIEIGKDPVVFEGKNDATNYIARITGIKKVTLDQATGPEDLNFVDVYDGPYLLGGRPETIQRKISGIVGANEIEDARNLLVKEKRKETQTLSNIEKEYNQINDYLPSNLDWLKVGQFHLNNIQELEKSWNDQTDKLKNVNEYINHNNLLLDDYTLNVVKNARILLNKAKNIEELLNLETQKYNSIISLKTALEDLNKNIEKLELEKSTLIRRMEEIKSSIKICECCGKPI